MKKLRRIIASLLPVLLLLTFLTGSASAALQAVGPTDPVTTIPSWYMDTNGLALVPCNDQNGFCIMGPGFDPAFPPFAPITTTGPISNANFPGEGFYYSADTSLPIEGGAATARLTFVMEYAFLAGVLPDAGIVFLRTDLVQMSNLVPNTTYRVTHPYGTFTFDTDAAGTTINGGNAIRFEDPAGVPAQWLPPLMKSAFITNIGPFLTRATGGLILDPLSGNTYIGDAVTPVAVTGGTNGNIFKIDRLAAGVPVPGASWQTPLFVLQGKVFTGQIPSPLNIDRVTYARDATGAGQVDVFATALPAATLSIAATTGLTSTGLTRDFPNTGKFFVDIPFAALPTGVTITNSLDVPPILYPITLVDEVNITQAFYNPITRSLTIKADSRDNLAPLPTLTVTVFGATNTLDATGTVVIPLPVNTIPPLTVTVNSTNRGSATAFVSVVNALPAPIALDDAATTIVGSTVVVNVVLNDTATAPLIINPASLAVSAASGGTAAANLDGTVSYTAPAIPGTYTFNYTVNDNAGTPSTSNVATVTMTVTVAISVAPIATAPNGTGIATTAAFTFTGDANTTEYSIWLQDFTTATGQAIRFTAAQAGCAGGTNCSYTPAVSPLTSSRNYAWVITGINTTGVGPYSAALNFDTTIQIPIPTAPIATTPTGIGVITTAAFTFTGDANATEYSIWLQDYTTATGQAIRFTAAQAGCAGGTNCSYTPAVSPLTSSRNYAWVVTGINAAGVGLYSAALYFDTTTIPIPIPIPTAPIATTPTGTGVITTAAFTFTGDANAMEYSIWLQDYTTATGQAIRFTAAQAGCAGGTNCSYTPAVSPLTSSRNYAWVVTGINTAGVGPYSAPLNFVVQ